MARTRNIHATSSTGRIGRLALSALAGLALAMGSTASAQSGGCRADLDGDGELTLFDFLQFQSLFDAGDPAADWDGDGELNIFDFLGYQNDFLAGCDPTGCRDLIPIDPFEAQFPDVIRPDFYPRIELEELPARITLDAPFVQIQAPFDDANPYEYGDDFTVFFCEDSGQWVVEITEAGIYHIVEDTPAGPSVSAILAQANLLEDADNPSTTGTTNTIDIHDADLVLGDKFGDEDSWDFYWEYFQQEDQPIEEVTSAADAAEEVCDAKPVRKLIIVNHGSPGQISVGDSNQRRDGKWFGKSADGTKLGAYDDFITPLKADGKFANDAEICLIGCNVGEGDAGQKLVDCVASDLGVRVRATKGSISFPKGKDGVRRPQVSGESGWAEGNP